jgi:8-oxo-dGTP diphosphatase
LRVPAFFREEYIDYADCRIRGTTEAAPDALVSRLHIVAITSQSHVLVCRSDQGGRFLPGGTREPGETLTDLARRELLEEAGATLRGNPKYFAAHIADTARDKPFRPHLPHPRTYWAYAVAEVEVTGPPTNPPDDELVVEVLALPPQQAADYIADHDPLHAEVLRLAEAMGVIQPHRPDLE